MTRTPAAAALTALVLLGWVPAVHAQTPTTESNRDHDRTGTAATDSVQVATTAEHHSGNVLGVWLGGSVYPGSLFGNLPDGHLALLGLRYSRRLLPHPSAPAHHGPTVTFTFDVIPASWLFIPEGTPPGSLSPLRPSLKERGLSTFGVGIYPVGLQVHFRSDQSIQPFVAGQTGIHYFLDPFPDLRGRHLNFAAAVGAGLRMAVVDGASLTVGYRYHHLSNGFRGSINPGLDGNILYLGLDLTP